MYRLNMEVYVYMCVIFTIKYLIYVLICILHILLKYINVFPKDIYSFTER